MNKLEKISTNCQVKKVDLLNIKGGGRELSITVMKEVGMTNEPNENEYPDDGTGNPDKTKTPTEVYIPWLDTATNLYIIR
jgi:hypothetical protein